MPTELTQVGVAGILVLLILDRILPFVRRNTNGKNHDMLEAHLIPLLQRQTEILLRLETITTAHHEAALKMSFQVNQAVEGVEKVRTTNHAIVQQLQSWPTKCPMVVGGHFSITGERLP